MTDPEPPRSPWARRGAILGVVLAVACHVLPPEHREICHAVAQLCSGGLLP